MVFTQQQWSLISPAFPSQASSGSSLSLQLGAALTWFPWFFTSCVAWIVFFLNGLCFKLSFTSFCICSAPYCPFTFFAPLSMQRNHSWMVAALVGHRIFTWLPGQLSVSTSWAGLEWVERGVGRGWERELGARRRAHLHLFFSLCSLKPHHRSMHPSSALQFQQAPCASATQICLLPAPRGLLLSQRFENTVWTRNDPVTLAKGLQLRTS